VSSAVWCSLQNVFISTCQRNKRRPKINSQICKHRPLHPSCRCRTHCLYT
jgi:hypothetical protein